MDKRDNNEMNVKKMIAIAVLTAAFSVGSAVQAFAASKYVEVTGYAVNVRNSANSTADVLKVVREGERYTYLSEETDQNGIHWYQLELPDGRQGWIMAAYSRTGEQEEPTTITEPTATTTTAKPTTTTTKAASTKQVEITGSTVNVRASADGSATKIGTTTKGKKYACLASQKDSKGRVWYQIQFTAKQKGWVIGTLSKLTDTPATTTTTAKPTTTTTTAKPTTTTTKATASTKQVEITGSTVNVRSDANQSASKIGSTVKGKKYTYLASKKAANGQVWYQIQFTAKQKGWVIGTLSKLTDTATTTTTTAKPTTTTTKAAASTKQVEITGSTVNVRSDANQSASKIGSTVKGKKYTYLASKKAANGQVWYQIQFTAKQKGWVIGTLSKLTDTAATAATTTAKPTTTTKAAASTKQVEITGSTVNVRSDANQSASKIGSTVKGKKYTYLASKKAANGQVWYQIQFTAKQKGWVIGTLSKLTDTAATTTTTAKPTTTTKAAASTKQVEITGSTVNVRSDANQSASKIGSTVKGKKYTYLASKKAANGQIWYQIQFTAKQKGWVIGTLSKLTTTSATTAKPTTTTTKAAVSTKQVEITGSTVNVRSGAGTSAAKVGATAKGKKYAYLASKKDANGQVWYQIQFTANTKGWVIGSLSKLS